MVIAGVVLQDVTDVGRVGDQKPLARADLEVNDIAEPQGRAHEHARRIAPASSSEPRRGRPRGPGGTIPES
jgi:hypothetical protein